MDPREEFEEQRALLNTSQPSNEREREGTEMNRGPQRVSAGRTPFSYCFPESQERDNRSGDHAPPWERLFPAEPLISRKTLIGRLRQLQPPRLRAIFSGRTSGSSPWLRSGGQPGVASGLRNAHGTHEVFSLSLCLNSSGNRRQITFP